MKLKKNSLLFWKSPNKFIIRDFKSNIDFLIFLMIFNNCFHFDIRLTSTKINSEKVSKKFSDLHYEIFKINNSDLDIIQIIKKYSKNS
jgi:hypothetical protein